MSVEAYVDLAPRPGHAAAPVMALTLRVLHDMLYLEHVRVQQKDGRIIWLTESGMDVEQYFNLPERNTAFLLLGKGTSITDAAVRRLAESNVIVGFCGSGGSPLFGMVDSVFLTPMSEYRPTEYMQAWARMWFDPARRLACARELLTMRVDYVNQRWRKNEGLDKRGVEIPARVRQNLLARAEAVRNPDTGAQELLLAEAEWARKLYRLLAEAYELKEFSRQEGAGKKETAADRVNSFLDHGNYIAYGLAAVALNGLGISYAFPLLHGKTRRGALVFDIADLIKDAWIMPLAFECGSDPRCKDNQFRGRLLETLHDHAVLDFMFDFVKKLAEKVY